MPATVEVEEKKVSDQAGEENELMLDGGFVVPPTNAFGHTFRALLDYDVNSDRSDGVEEFYRINYINQSVDFVSKQRQIRFSSIWRSLFERDKVKGEGEKHQMRLFNSNLGFLVPQLTYLVITVETERRSELCGNIIPSSEGRCNLYEEFQHVQGSHRAIVGRKALRWVV
ncbi:unnamed protein product [Prunus armeniaca]|uniref:Uncharacterized protein n=1 Tax=Prunus armeniaca TaxID=36596 RepID=A0A6J5TY91_PRUAR|nr:unnamed protein product [Prunus armeniaca]